MIKMLMNKPHLLLINPWIYDFAAYDYWAKPLGLLKLAALLRENGYRIIYFDALDIHHPGLRNYPELKIPPRKTYGDGHFVKRVVAKPPVLKNIPRNYRRYGIPPSLLRQDLLNLEPPAAVLVTSGMTYWYPGVREAIQIAKEIFPTVPVILGGIYASLCPSHAQKYSGADYLITGQGESKVLHLLNQLTGKTSTNYQFQEELDFYPYPAWDLLRGIDYIVLFTTRGCPYYCSYCASPLLNPQFHRRNPIKVVDEIQFWVQKYQVKNFAFYDDALLWKPEEHLIPLLQEIIRRGIKVNFHCPNGLHVRGITAQVARLMHLGQFRTLRLGLETSSDQRQKETGGKVTNEEFIAAVKYLQEAGYHPPEIGVYLLAGLPEQTAKEVEESIRFVQKCGARPIITEYSPIPGTSLWKKAVLHSPFDLENEPLFQNNSLLPCQWEKFTPSMLERLKLLSRQTDMASRMS